MVSVFRHSTYVTRFLFFSSVPLWLVCAMRRKLFASVETINVCGELMIFITEPNNCFVSKAFNYVKNGLPFGQGFF